MVTIDDIYEKKISKITIEEFDSIYDEIRREGRRINDTWFQYGKMYGYYENNSENICTPTQLIVKKHISSPYGFFSTINIYHKSNKDI